MLFFSYDIVWCYKMSDMPSNSMAITRESVPIW